MTFEAGTIVLIPFPYSDLSVTKKRPVLMLTQPDGFGDFVAMPLTTKTQRAPALKVAAGALPLGGALPLNSWVKTGTVFSLSESQIVKPLGRVAEGDRAYCVQQLCQYLSRGN